MSGFCCWLPRLPPARAAFFLGCRCCRAALADHRGFCCQQRPRHWRGRQRWQQQQQHQPWQPLAAPAPPQQHPMGICSSAPAASACTACTNTNTGSSAALGRQVGHVVYAGVSLSPAALRLQHNPQSGVSMNSALTDCMQWDTSDHHAVLHSANSYMVDYGLHARTYTDTTNASAAKVEACKVALVELLLRAPHRHVARILASTHPCMAAPPLT